MPVWHARTKELRAAGELTVIGIVQEQHPDRARLFAAWHGLDFPILWDPFGTTGVTAVPVVTFADEHGIVRATRIGTKDPSELAKLVAATWPAPEEPVRTSEPFVAPALGMTRIAHPPGSLDEARAEMSRVIWYRGAPERAEAALDRLVAVLEGRLAGSPEAGGAPADVTAADRFRAGVARRLRFDSPYAKPGDFQAALDHWLAALSAEPNQYIWRRRIQQWGPRLDKPYPFYDWIERAISEIEARGETAPAVRVPLSGAEVAGATTALPRLSEPEVAPDPERKIALDAGKLVRIDGASAPHSKVAEPGAALPVSTVRVHVTLDPLAGAHWPPDADPPIAWIVVPQGWQIERNAYTFPRPPAGAADGAVTIDFELAAPEGVERGSVRGYALYHVCEPDGACVYRRQDFDVPVVVRRAAKD